MSWGRHGWPRTNEGFRLYKERDEAYLMLDIPAQGGYYSAIANAFKGPEPSLGSCSVALNFTYVKGCKRVQWSELPKEWKAAFIQWINVKPKDVRGFWLVGHQPK